MSETTLGREGKSDDTVVSSQPENIIAEEDDEGDIILPDGYLSPDKFKVTGRASVQPGISSINAGIGYGMHKAKSITGNVVSTTVDMTGDALSKLGEATIGKESVDVVNAHIHQAEQRISGAVGAATDVVESATGKLTGMMTTAVQNDSLLLKQTFDSATELGKGAMAKAFKHTEIDALALRLLRGHCVYSKSYRSDLWLHLKNKQIFLSLFLAHPQHPFNRKERISALIVSCLLAWGLEFWFCIYWKSCDDHPEMNFVEMFIKVLLLKIAISASLNGIYDAILEQAMTCACVQEGCPLAVKNGCELLSLVQLLIQLGGGVLMLGMGAMALAGEFRKFGVPGRSQGFEDETFYKFVGITIRELFIGKMVGLFVVTVLIETLAFHFTRKAQMKPLPKETEALEAWDDETIKGCCGVVKPPPNTLWNRFIGKDIEVAQLPDYAPTYDVDVYCCGKIIYTERAENPGRIPNWFLEKDDPNKNKNRKGNDGAGSLIPSNPGRVVPIQEEENISDSDPEPLEAGLRKKDQQSHQKKETVTIVTADDRFISGVVVEASIE